MNDDKNDKGTLDYLSKYRASEEASVSDATFLTFVMHRPHHLGGAEYTHVSLPYDSLMRVEYFDGRWKKNWRDLQDAKPELQQEEEHIILAYVHGERVRLVGCFLESLHRRILRQETDTIREVQTNNREEVAEIRKRADGRPIVYFIDPSLDVED